MKRFELKIKVGRSVVFQAIYEFTERQYRKYLQTIVSKEHSMLRDELQDVIIKARGTRYWVKQYCENGQESLSEIDLKEFSKKYPKMLITAHIQASCYDCVSFSKDIPNIDCSKEEFIICNLSNYSFVCKTLD